MTQISNPNLGTENGYRGSDQFPIHVVNNGTREGKRVPRALTVTQPTCSFRSIQSIL